MEMLETSAVLRHATADSLVVLDELGRGTSTHDGHAVAYAVLSELEREVGCRTLFATHYHALADDFANSSRVQARMMSYVVQDGQLVLLFKLVPGVTPSSFGMNVARLAGVPEHVVAHAERLAADLNETGSVLRVRFAAKVRRLCGSLT